MQGERKFLDNKVENLAFGRVQVYQVMTFISQLIYGKGQSSVILSLGR